MKFDESAPEHHYHYTIRMKSNLFQTDQQYSRDLPTVTSKEFNEYINNGFAGLQCAIDMELFKTVTSREESDYHIELERFPSPAHDPKASKLDEFGLYFIIFSVFICISLIFTRIVEEKSCGFREQLKNATRFSFLNNVALFTINHLQMLLLFVVCLAITCLKGFWFSVNIFYPALLIFVYITSIISFTFLVSAFFESSKIRKITKLILKLTKTFFVYFSRICNSRSDFLVFRSIFLLPTGDGAMEENFDLLPNQRFLPRLQNFPRLHKFGSLLLPPELLSKIASQRWSFCNVRRVLLLDRVIRCLHVALFLHFERVARSIWNPSRTVLHLSKILLRPKSRRCAK